MDLKESALRKEFQTLVCVFRKESRSQLSRQTTTFTNFEGGVLNIPA